MSTNVRWETVSGFDAIVLENRLVRAVVLPALGGRVWELTDRMRDRQWIWHREDLPLTAAVSGAIYDDVWAGGWEELFPNDAPCEFEGRALPDHGIWWTINWRVSTAIKGDVAILRLTATTSGPHTGCVKEFRLGSDSNTLRVSYRIKNHEQNAFHFLFKQHFPIALSPLCRLALPGGRVTAVDTSFGTLLTSSEAFAWPRTVGASGIEVDLTRVLDRSSAAREFVYVSDLPDAWCGVEDLERGASLRLRYDRKQLPYVWLFLTYGGWRGCHTAVLEPCTNMPKDLDTALRRGQSARLLPGEVFETHASVTLCELGVPR